MRAGVAGVFPLSVADTTDGRLFPAPGGPAAGLPACAVSGVLGQTTYAGAFDPAGDPTEPGDGDNWLLTSGSWISFDVH